jgi:Ca2+-binding EF-hand superfamily protein
MNLSLKALLAVAMMPAVCSSSNSIAKPGGVDVNADDDEQAENIKQLKEIFKEGDADSNGYHSLSEIQDVLLIQAKASLIDSFNDADKNNDGQVSQKEYLLYLPDKTAAEFAFTDTNSDGKHTLDEQLSHFSESAPYKKEMEQALSTAKLIIKHDDKNGDGKLSEEEFLAHSQELLKPIQDEISFKQADFNKDGFHSLDEILTEIMYQSGFEKKTDGQFVEMGLKEGIKKADLNKDNVVTKEEYLKAWKDANVTAADFDKADLNKDGKTDLAEAEKYQSKHLMDTLKDAKQQAKAYMDSADKNGDGKLDLEEKNEAVELKSKADEEKHHKELFKSTDRNGDGFHDLDEIKSEMILQAGYTAVHNDKDGKNEFQYFLPDHFLEGFRLADTNKDEVVTKEEFMKTYKDNKDAENHFKEADHDGDGKHTLNEMAAAIFESEEFKKLHQDADENSKKLLKEADEDGDGKVSDSEFFAYLLLAQARTNRTALERDL